MSTPQLTWLADLEAERRCAVCGAETKLQAVVRTQHRAARFGDVTYYRCPVCASLTSAAAEVLAYTDEEYFAPHIWDHYIHVGAGIDYMVRPIERVRGDGAPTLLDVGCGFGFTVDYWARMSGAAAVGVEPSRYGALGRDVLQAHIYNAMLDDVPELAGRRFDRVFSSEVIEHVPDPQGFVAMLRARLSPGGVLVLTTPSADAIQPGTASSLVLAALSPGLHGFLMSGRALRRALEQAGFAHVTIEHDADRLIAWASDAPLVIAPTDSAIRARYIDYLRGRTAAPIDNEALSIGLGYRVFKELVNDGRIDEAVDRVVPMLDSIRARYGLDLHDSAAVRRALLGTPDLRERGTRAPYCFSCLAFYVAMASRQGWAAGPDAAATFDLAAELCGEDLRVDANHAQESASLYWVAVLEAGMAHLANGDRPAALERLERLTLAGPPAAPHLGFATRPPELVARAWEQAGIAHLQSARPKRAMECFRTILMQPAAAVPPSVRESAAALWRQAQDAARGPVEATMAAPPSLLQRALRRLERLRRG